jgi:hypothetical protein
MDRTTRSDLFVAIAHGFLNDGIGIRFLAGGRSMTPTVRDGEYLTVVPTAAGEVAVGDIAFCQARRGPVAHRIVSIESRSDGASLLTLCGDASEDCDIPLPVDRLRGKVTSVEREGRSISLAVAGGWVGRVALVGALRLRRSMRVARATGAAGLAFLVGQP